MITSIQNPRLKHIRKLLSSAKERRETQTYIIETPRAITEILNHNPDQLRTLLFDRPHAILETVSHETIETIEVAPDCFKTLHTLKTSPGIIAIANIPTLTYPKTITTALYLDGIQSPSNMGTIIRNAAAFGCSLIAYPKHSVDPYHPDSVRASAGTLTKLPLIETDISTLSQHYPQANPYILDANQGENIFQLSTLPKQRIIRIGSEKGFSDTHHTTALKIPMQNNVDSLNVATATGILLAQLSTH